MILMLAPAPDMSFPGMPSGSTYVSNQYGLITILNDSVADQTALQDAGCYTLSPFGGWGRYSFPTLADLYAADLGAILPGRTGFPQFTTCQIFNDPMVANNAVWYKTGTGNGAGSWTVTSILHDLLVDIDRAYLQSMMAEIGSDLSDVTSASVGTLLGSGNPTNNARIQLSVPVAHTGFTTGVEWSMSAAGTGAIYACELLPDGTYKVIYARAVTSVAGANSADISDSPFMSAQARWGYERFDGGSVLYQATAGAISPYLDASAVAAVGDIVPVAGTSPVTIGMRITQLYAPAPLSDRITAAEAQAASARDALSAALLATYPLSETVGDVTAIANPASNSYWWATAPFVETGPLRAVRIDAQAAGTGTLILAQIDGGTLTPLHAWAVTVTGGADTIDIGALGAVYPPVGSCLLWVPGTSVGLHYRSGGTSYRIAAGADVSIGAEIPCESYAATVSIEATIGYAQPDLSHPAAPIVPTLRTTFPGAARAAGWALTGMSWSDGLVPTAAGWTASRAVYGAPSCAADRIARVGVTLAAATDAPGLLYDCSLVEAYGAGVVLNGQSGALELYAVDATGTATLAASVDLPSDYCAAGGHYVIEAIKHRLSWSMSVTRESDGAQYAYSYVFNNTSAPANSARMMGAPGVVSLNGSPRIDWYEHTVPVAASPHVVVLGDSNYEGSSIALTSTDWRHAWTYALDDARGRGDVVLAVRGGDETIHTLPRLAADCTSWRARYAIIGLGTNDSGPQIWQPNMAAMITACEAAGIEPVLVTYPPYAAAQDRINGYNEVVLSGALGRHRVIDIAAAVTVGGDRVTPIAGYFNADNLHLTVAGHRAVWVWILANAPYLLDGARSDAFQGRLVPGWWKTITGVPRLRLSGTGTVSIDVRDYAGTVTTNFWSSTLTSATGQIVENFIEADTVAVRITATGNLIAEII